MIFESEDTLLFFLLMGESKAVIAVIGGVLDMTGCASASVVFRFGAFFVELLSCLTAGSFKVTAEESTFRLSLLFCDFLRAISQMATDLSSYRQLVTNNNKI